MGIIGIIIAIIQLIDTAIDAANKARPGPGRGAEKKPLVMAAVKAQARLKEPEIVAEGYSVAQILDIASEQVDDLVAAKKQAEETAAA